MKRCKHCGQRIRERKESLSRGLVKTLVKFGRAVNKLDRNEVHPRKEVSLDKSEYNNFQKLRYFGLVAKVEDRAGYWLITRNGGAFLRGEFLSHKYVTVRDNRVVAYSDERVGIHDSLEDIPYWMEKDDYLKDLFKPVQKSLL